MQQSNYCGLPNSPHFPPVASKRVVTPLPPNRPQMERQMTHAKSDGEVYGSKVLTLAIIAISAFILAGTVYSPSQPRNQVNPVAEQQIVDTTQMTTPGVSG